MQPAYFGAVTELFAGFSPETEGATLNGKYIVPWGRVGNPRSDIERALPESGERLWKWCEGECKEFM